MKDDELFRIHASFCRVFSNPKRLKIMWLLADCEMSVGDIADELGVSIANASQHLRVMRDQGAVSMRKEGQNVYYKVSNPNFSKGARLIRKGLVQEHKIKGTILLEEEKRSA
jgi:ArsR family transcriptional regulator